MFVALYRQLGLRWSIFRLTYAFRLRTGLIQLQTPQYKWSERPLNHWMKENIPSDIASYVEYRRNHLPTFFFDSKLAGRVTKVISRSAIDKADKLLSGQVQYFFHQFHETNFPPNWYRVTLSESKTTQTDMDKHWSQISDDSNMDIKFIWEPNRFAFVYTLVRAYAANQDEKYAQAFWSLIEDWAKQNPPNTGANWKDGQEIALRLMAWMFGYYAFFNFATPEQLANFTIYVAAQAERIYKNIGYAISTRSNHTISEGFGLWMVGLLFPELKDSEEYCSLGKKILEKEIEQIFPDGSYAMYSLNYHRFILHIYLYAQRLGELNHAPLSVKIKQSVSRSIEYLSNLIDFETGQIPFLGSNDGALVLPLNNCDFTDFRPLLQLGSYATKSELLFETGEWDEDIFWLYDKLPVSRVVAKQPTETNKLQFPDGGVYVLKNTNSKAIIHCRDFKSRPSHADQMHVDLWLGSQNIAIDAGTYLYSGEGVWRNGLAHTSVHNTVTVDKKDQMNMVSRFTWTNWSKGKVLRQNEKLWQGEHDSYQPVSHQRRVLSIEEDRWLVIDDLKGNESHLYTLHWLLNDFPYQHQLNSILLSLGAIQYKMQVGVLSGKGDLSIIRADENSTRGWRSQYYAHKEPAISVQLETNQTQVTFWTFFGFAADEFEISERTFKLNKKEINF